MNNYTELKSKRFERKYIIEDNVFDPEQIIKQHPAFFSEIFNERYINNIYFDTPDLSFYFDNTYGKSNRKKVRIRWYGNLFGKIEHPILEIKIKNGQIGTKLSFILNSFEINNNTTFSEITNIIAYSKIPSEVLSNLLTLKPTLINRYKRKYFTELTKNFRFTIDKNITYYNIKPQNNLFKEYIEDKKYKIIELKYDFEFNNKAPQIMEKLPFRLTKNSKYVNGIEYFNNIAE